MVTVRRWAIGGASSLPEGSKISLNAGGGVTPHVVAGRFPARCGRSGERCGAPSSADSHGAMAELSQSTGDGYNGEKLELVRN